MLTVRKALRPLMPEVAGWMIMAAEVAGAPARVRVDLRAKEFAAACDALRDDRAVEVKRTIRNDVRTREFVLHDPSDFHVDSD